MSNLENNFSIYPYGYEDELEEKRAAMELLRTQEEAQRTYLDETIARPADATARSIGDLAIQSFTGGILHASFDTQARSPELSPARNRQLGKPAVRHLVSIDRSPMLLHESITQPAINERAILGHAQHRAA